VSIAVDERQLREVALTTPTVTVGSAFPSR